MRRLLAHVLALFVSTIAFAWHDTGHMVVAEIASRSLTPKARIEIDRLLAIGGTPKTADLLTAACWADDTKNQKTGLWHYINYHFDLNGKPTANIPEAENIVWAIRTYSEVIKSKDAKDLDKADALRYLLHFVGDIHMPLHNVARDTKVTPGGDRGGNDFKVIAPVGMLPAPRNLHFLWDMGAGAFTAVERSLTGEGRMLISRIADSAMTSNPMSSFGPQLAKADPEDWSHEGVELAKKKVYKLTEGAEPSKKYIEMCRKESMRQVALAGYRLGDLLNRLFESLPTSR